MTMHTEPWDSSACVCCGVCRMAIYIREIPTGSALLMPADRGVSIGYF